MANIQAPNGFRAVRRIDGAALNFLTNVRLIASNDTTPIGYGDPVTSLNTGYITRSTAGTTTISGIFMGCEYYDTSQQKWMYMPNWPGTSTTSGEIRAYITNDVNVVFEAQSNGTAIGLADIGANINFVIGSPNTSGISTTALNQSTINTTATLPFRIVGISTRVGTDPTSSYNWAEVVLNNADFKTTTGV
ncbi:hypothetical protein [Ancylobacter sp.]|uniref:hypothetical protein n=1 Tax=Ancylobacter sp. TaxID=1872567 RepID=UPI003BADA1C9